MELSDLDVAESVLDLIGETPMVQLKKLHRIYLAQ